MTTPCRYVLLVIFIQIYKSQLPLQRHPSLHLAQFNADAFAGRTLSGACCSADCSARSCRHFFRVEFPKYRLRYSFPELSSNDNNENAGIPNFVRTQIIREADGLSLSWNLLRVSDEAIIDSWPYNNLIPRSLQTFGVEFGEGVFRLGRSTFFFKYLCGGYSGPFCNTACTETQLKFCDSQTGFLVCKNGKFGADCTQQLHACDSNPCQNEGICINFASSYRCVCKDSYSGVNCETQTCDPLQCSNGVCINELKCLCLNGFIGTDCQQQPCDENYCNTYGTCTTIGTNLCECYPTMAYGPRCEFACTRECRNGGVCEEFYGTPACNCDGTGFRGIDCSDIINVVDPCDPNPCKNGGECTSFGFEYTCNCDGVWTGTECEDNICNLRNCIHGSCMLGGICNCVTGYSGDNCDVPSCENFDLCQNEGTCIEEPFAQCACNSNTNTGQNCEIVCNPLCENGICSIIEGKVVCVCNEGFGGDLCQYTLPISNCINNPCQNGGVCFSQPSLPSGYRCECIGVFTGVNCEDTECNISNCEYGICVGENGCICASGYTDSSCYTATCSVMDEVCESRGYGCVVRGIVAECDCPRTEAVQPDCEYKCEPTCVNGYCSILNGGTICVCDTGYYGTRCNSTIEYTITFAIFVVLVILTVLTLLGIIPVIYFLVILKKKDKSIAERNDDFLHPEAAKRMIPDSNKTLDDTYAAFKKKPVDSDTFQAETVEPSLEFGFRSEKSSRRHRKEGLSLRGSHQSSDYNSQDQRSHNRSRRRHGEGSHRSRRRHGERSHRSTNHTHSYQTSQGGQTRSHRRHNRNQQSERSYGDQQSNGTGFDENAIPNNRISSRRSNYHGSDRKDYNHPISDERRHKHTSRHRDNKSYGSSRYNHTGSSTRRSHRSSNQNHGHRKHRSHRSRHTQETINEEEE